MKKSLLSVLLICGVLLVAFIPLRSMLFDFSGDIASSSPEYAPIMRIPADADKNHNGIEDSLDQEIADRLSSSMGQDYVNVTVMLKTEPTAHHVVVFASSGGLVMTSLWRYALYGFGGRIFYSGIGVFVKQCPDVLLVEKAVAGHADLAYAAQQVGARAYVWNTLGLQGDPDASTAIVDTGIDDFHADFSLGYGDQDFSKKIVGWDDEVGSATSPVDDNGHGSHCAGLAAGNGFFSVDASGYATATWGANLGSVSSSGIYFGSGMMVNRTGTITIKVKWASTGTAKLSSLPLFYGDKTLSTGSWSAVALVGTPSQNTWYTLTYNVGSTPSGGYDMYHVTLEETVGTGDLYVAFNMSWPYTPPSDGFSAWTGIAPQSKLVGVKALDYSGVVWPWDLTDSIDWIIANKIVYHITVASMSLSWSSEQPSLDLDVLNLVNSGVTTVVSAGNKGTETNKIYTPGSVDEVITVAAMNHVDDITDYSSEGGASRSTGQTTKPDITAPGGSFPGVPLFSVDSNDNDAETRFTEIQADDAAPMQGTSMSAPIIAGCAQVVIQAMGGYAEWSWTKSQALQPKMFLLMTATETYPNLREFDTSTYSPTLDRGSKDVHEGYGRVNLDAAVDAVLKTYQIGTTVSDTLGMPPTLADISVLGQRLAWARNVQLVSGTQYNFSLSVPSGADYDLYLYNTTGNAYGEPVIVASSTTATVEGVENISYTPSLSGEYYIVVKRAREDTGAGEFTLTSTPRQAAHLLLSVEPTQTSYVRGQSVTFTVNVFNQLSPALESSLTLTVTGPSGYYHYDFQSINVTADTVDEYSFSWAVPDFAGSYIVETSLVPAQLTAYDAVWLEAG